MGNPVELKAPADQLLYQFDWSGELGADVILQSVQHFVPSPLIILEEQFDVPSATSLVRISGGRHGGLYVVTATGQLSDGEVVYGQFVLRVVQPANSDDNA